MAGEQLLANSDRRFDYGLSAFAVLALSIAAAVVVLACRTNPNAATQVRGSAADGHTHRMAANPLETFLARWTTIAETAGGEE